MIETGVLKFEYSQSRADTDDLLNINNKFIQSLCTTIIQINLELCARLY